MEFYPDKKCIICDTNLYGQCTVTLKIKGSDGINKASELRGSDIRTIEGQTVHSECSKNWCNSKVIESLNKRTNSNIILPLTLRSKSVKFELNLQCLFCGQEAKCNGKKKVLDVYPVRTHTFRKKIIEACRSRNDQWSEVVLGRLSFSEDLHAAGAVYHNQCSVNFRIVKVIPREFRYDKKNIQPKVRAEQEERRKNLFFAVQYLEGNIDRQITVGDLVKIMKNNLITSGSQCQAYSEQYMKKRLAEYFGNNVVFTNVAGQVNVVTFRSTASTILHEHYKAPKEENYECDKIRIIKTAAKLIKNDVKMLQMTEDSYPLTEDMSSARGAVNFLPPTLKVFFETAFERKSDKKVASIGQAIVQAIRPRVLVAPLQLGLAVQMHHHFASRFLIDSLHQHGFCSSYSEVQKYERNASTTSNLDTKIDPNQFVQYVGDNVDHNINTLDGHGTFHGMGLIATVTPGKPISRTVPKKMVPTRDIINNGRVNIKLYKNSAVIPDMKYEELRNFTSLSNPTKLLTDILWKFSPFVKCPRPGWSGFMHIIHQGPHPGKSSIVFLPMIDLDPTDKSYIYSNLLFLCDEAKENNCTPIVTFDQPLWWKAFDIIAKESAGSCLKEVVLLLGGLHTEMSFLGSIGDLMEGTGLRETLETVYGSNAVIHILSGKAPARAKRGHMLVDAALNILLIANALKMPLPNEWCTDISQQEDEQCVDLLSQNPEIIHENACGSILGLVDIYDKLMSGESLDVESNQVLADLSRTLEAAKVKCKDNSRTGCVWIQYMTMIDILRNYIRAERTGDWKLHLKSLKDMLPYFAAAGHNLYTKTVYVHLKNLQNLEISHPDVYSKFINGLHVVRRSEHQRAGLSTDLVIEQALMRSVKATGGLTRGRGMTEVQRQVWVQAMLPCTEVNNAMQEFTGAIYHTSEQHKEETVARQARDLSDSKKLLAFLVDQNPFSIGEALCNITTGVVAGDAVNVDKAEEVGNAVIEQMKGQNIWNYSIKRSGKAVTMGMKNVLVNKEAIQIDPQFQRLMIISEKQNTETKEIFKYELCSYPASLFDKTLFPREAKKHILADAIWKQVKECQGTTLTDPLYVLDGGALLHRIKWLLGIQFKDICSAYAKYVLAKYGKATVVFDGYEDGPSIKDTTHIRRTKVKKSQTVLCTTNMTLTMKKDEFLANKSNKQRFLKMLSDSLQEVGCKTIHASGDADLLIVHTAIHAAEYKDVVVVADDTDVLVLLCFHYNSNGKQIVFKPEPKMGSTKNRTWNIQATKKKLGQDVCSGLLFVHSLLGCDTTSQLFGIGKGQGLTMMMNNPSFNNYSEVFNNPYSTKQDIISAGEQALVCLYGGKSSDTLDHLRYRRFSAKATNKKATQAVQPQSLPPTSAAAKYHSFRVFYQIQVWNDNATLSPLEWGWKLHGGQLIPLMTDLKPAPTDILQVIRCNCKTDCTTSRCSCHLHGLQCSSACGECHGILCKNTTVDGIFEEEV